MRRLMVQGVVLIVTALVAGCDATTGSGDLAADATVPSELDTPDVAATDAAGDLATLDGPGTPDGAAPDGAAPDAVAPDAAAPDAVAQDATAPDGTEFDTTADLPPQDDLEGPDVVAVDTTNIDPGTADDAIDATDGPDLEPCPLDYFAADGTPCATEDRLCGGGCTDPCQFCNMLRCEGGKWNWLEAFPDPNCRDSGGEDIADDSADDVVPDLAIDAEPPGDAPADVTAPPASRVSLCGGFANAPRSLGNYCAQGVLDWHRDVATGALVLTDRRVLLNCCGDHSVTMAREGDTWVLGERDAPQGGSVRCKCSCVFDFEVAVPAFPDGVAHVRIVRLVTDSGQGPLNVWEGDIVVGASPGSIVVDSDPVGYGCETD